MDLPKVDMITLFSFLGSQEGNKRSYDGYSITLLEKSVESLLNKFVLSAETPTLNASKCARIEVSTNGLTEESFIYYTIINYNYKIRENQPDVIFEKLFPKDHPITPEEDIKEPSED